jgi:hypothetical protein
MRCPKCGFISFDHLEKCLKCSKEFKDTSGIIQGTVYNVQAPSFLKIQNEAEKKKFGEDIEIDNDSLGEDFDLEDPDLEILLDEEEEVENPPATGSSLRLEKDAGEFETAPQGEFELSLDTGKEEEEDEQMSIDLGQFQNDLDDGETGLGDIFADSKGGEKVNLELPDELADISDLEPPRKQVSPPPLQKSAGRGRAAEAFDFSLDLDLDGLDETRPTPPPVKTAKKEESLSLDAIDLSTAVRPGSASRKGGTDSMNMDEELNFDLDLGGLSLHKD